MTFALFTFMYVSIGEFEAPGKPQPLPELTKITPDIDSPVVPPKPPRPDLIEAAAPPPAQEPYSAPDVEVFIPVPREVGRAPRRLEYGDLMPTAMTNIEPEKQLQPITAPNVVYPPSMLRREIEGSCEVRFDVSARGEPFNIQADCTHPGFERSAERAVASAKFSPKVVRGQPVERRNVVYPIDYAMDL